MNDDFTLLQLAACPRPADGLGQIAHELLICETGAGT
jgi:hypothetical protein